MIEPLNWALKMKQEFADKLNQAGNDKQMLIALMADIDSEKRAIKSKLSQLSSEPDPDFVKGRQRQEVIRRMKDKLSFLVEEREIVRNKIASIKSNKKALQRKSNSIKAGFAEAFMVAAEQILSEEDLVHIETRAAEILASAKATGS